MSSTMNKRKANADKVLAGIKLWYTGNAYGPSYRDLARITSISLGAVFSTCKELREEGLIEFEDGIARSIKIVKGKKS